MLRSRDQSLLYLDTRVIHESNQIFLAISVILKLTDNIIFLGGYLPRT